MKSKGFTVKDVSRITSAIAKKNGGQIPKDSLGARVQRIVATGNQPKVASIKKSK